MNVVVLAFFLRLFLLSFRTMYEEIQKGDLICKMKQAYGSLSFSTTSFCPRTIVAMWLEVAKEREDDGFLPVGQHGTDPPRLISYCGGGLQNLGWYFPH